jgi:flap endonuclease-1
MGIKGLFKFIKKYAPSAITELTVSNLKNKTIAFDTSILIYQFVIAIRNQGIDLQNDRGEITSHIHAIIMKTLSFFKKKINPVYVFDGKPPAIKHDTLKERVKSRHQAIENLEKKVDMDEDEKIKLLKQSVVISHKQMEECKEILRLIGIPVIVYVVFVFVRPCNTEHYICLFGF